MIKNSYLICILLSACFYSAFANSPKTVSELWKDFDPRAADLEIQSVETWTENNIQTQLVRYSLGTLKGTNKTAKPIMAAYYAFPKNKTNLPAILHIHGGGQRANKNRVQYWASIGYAAISINWGGKVLEKANTPNTNWDGLAAGFIGNKSQTHHNEIEPSPYTLYKEVHPMNSSWMLIATAARRAITFLEQQEVVNSDRIGVEGHSMGGRSTSYTSIDPRLKASSPSVGGSGYLYNDMWGLPGSARRMKEHRKHYQATISSQNYWPLVTCPTLFLGSTNDFNSPTEFVVQGLDQIPSSTEKRLALAPHLNHRFTDSTTAARVFWMETHLKKNMEFPKTSKASLELNTPNHIPLFKVWPDQSTSHKIVKVDIYYGFARDPRIRFWRDAQAQKVGDHYEAECPIFDSNEPLFVFANITYDTERVITMPAGSQDTSHLCIASDYLIAYPNELKANKVLATEKPERVIDDFSRGFHDWYILAKNNTQHWHYATRKILDPKWMAPQGAKLSIELTTAEANNDLLITLEQNTWQGYTGRARDTYFAIAKLPAKGKNKLMLSLSEFKNSHGKTLRVWNESTEIGFSGTAHSKLALPHRSKWKGEIPSFEKLAWEGGQYQEIFHPHQIKTMKLTKNAVSFDEEFQNSIKESVKLEQLDRSKRKL